MGKTKKAVAVLAVGVIAVLGVTATEVAVAGQAIAGPRDCC